MFKILRNFLSKDEVKNYKEFLDKSQFQDGKLTAFGLSKKVKNNLQLDSKKHNDFIKQLTKKIANHPAFMHYTMIDKIIPVTIGKYTKGMTYGNHMDNVEIQGVRTDISFTLFLNEPDTYEGGELVVDTELGEQKFKLNAGDMIIYPSLRLHRVNEVTKGERLVIISWVQSKIKNEQKRDIVIEMKEVVDNMKKYATQAEIDQALKLHYKIKHMWINTT